MTTLYKHRIKCTTDNKFEYIWLDTDVSPIACPSNTSHSIDASLSSIVDHVDRNQVTIVEEASPTGGNFKCETKVINAAASTDTEYDFSFPYDISILAVYMVTTASHEGDLLNVLVSPDTVIGTTTGAITSSDTVINVSDTVLEFIYVGYKIKITDGVNTDDMGYVIGVNKVNKTILVQNPAVNSFNTGAFIQNTVYYVENYEIGPPWEYVIGESKIGASKVPKNTVVRLKYTNNTVSSKKLIIKLEYLY
jgi:hypothetical protein